MGRITSVAQRQHCGIYQNDHRVLLSDFECRKKHRAEIAMKTQASALEFGWLK